MSQLLWPGARMARKGPQQSKRHPPGGGHPKQGQGQRPGWPRARMAKGQDGQGPGWPGKALNRTTATHRGGHPKQVHNMYGQEPGWPGARVGQGGQAMTRRGVGRVRAWMGRWRVLGGTLLWPISMRPDPVDQALKRLFLDRIASLTVLKDNWGVHRCCE